MTKDNSRLQKPLKQWFKACFWSLIYILFVAWVGNFWWILLLPIIFDAFITKFIAWSWWKNSKNVTVRSIMSWVDAIVFALVAVYFINTYLFQNYQIPTSSLEKTLKVGDFLLVSKASYGPRIPNTPLSFPLVQNTFPIINTKSYIEKPQWKYRRLRGITNIKRDDIVVFNFPTGDTVPLKLINMTTDDYYATAYQIGRNIATQNGNMQFTDKFSERETFLSLGRNHIKAHPEMFGEIVWRPIDRRENYVKRCVGMPADKLEIINNQVFINDKPQEKFEKIQFNYFVQTDGTVLSRKLLDKLEISNEDCKSYVAQNLNPEIITQLGLTIASTDVIYYFPLTEGALSILKQTAGVKKIVIDSIYGGEVFPVGNSKNWTRDNFGPILIPAKGQTLAINTENILVYERIISSYEHNKLEIRDSIIYINDKPATDYTFQMDYYFMMGDNRHNSLDSRYWGFVPEDHIVGRPVFVWLSLDKDKGWFSGKIRWNRFFKNAKR